MSGLTITSWTKRVEPAQNAVTIKKITFSDRGPKPIPVPRPMPSVLKQPIIPMQKPEAKPIPTAASADLSKCTTLEEMIAELKRVKGPDTITVNGKSISIQKSAFSDVEIKALFNKTFKGDELVAYLWYR